MKCAICHARARGFEYRPKENWHNKARACGMKHLRMINMNSGFTHTNEDEVEAAMAGMKEAWGYCKSINKTDIATFSQTEAKIFSTTFRNAYVKYLAQIADLEIPF